MSSDPGAAGDEYRGRVGGARVAGARGQGDFAVACLFDTPVPRRIEALTAMYERASWRPIGRLILYNMDWRGRTAASSARPACGQGYSTEATRLVFDYAFTALGLHSVMLIAGQAAYRKTGSRSADGDASVRSSSASCTTSS